MSVALPGFLIGLVLSITAGCMMSWDEKRRNFWGLVALRLVATTSCFFFATRFASSKPSHLPVQRPE